MKHIRDQAPSLPSQVPVMVLPNAVLFPHALLPLYIFEPRYRAMLAWALEHERMFCVALMKPGVEEAHTAEDFYQIAGVGLIRACVGRDDGTSHLILQGMARVRFAGFNQEQPFRIAEIEEVRTLNSVDADAEKLSTAALALCARMRENGMSIPENLDEQLQQVSDPAMLADIVAHAFLRNAERRQSLLEEPRADLRLRSLIRHLEKEADLD